MGDVGRGSAVVEGPVRVVKETVRRSEAVKQIASLEFGTLDASECARLAAFEIKNGTMYTSRRAPAPDGPLDPRLGPIDKRARCTTCGKDLADCAGHWGYIRLLLPVFHIGFFKNIVQILQMICKQCSRILLPEPERSELLRRVRRPKITSESHVRNAMFKRVWTRSKKNVVCMYCGAIQGPVKRVGVLKIVHYPQQVKLTRMHVNAKKEDLESDFTAVLLKNPDIERHLGKAADDLTALKVLRLFERIPDADVELLLMNPKVGRPERLVMTSIAVPPVCIRPSVCADPTVGSTEDDLTILFSQIANTNNGIKEALIRGSPVEQVFELWEFIQVLCAKFINADLPGVPPSASGSKPVRGLSQRLKGKTGRFRGNLSGKRVDFTSRTVISPDPNLRIDEVGVPVRVAKILTYPERVTAFNVERLRAAIVNGPEKYPGANFIELPDKTKRYLKYGDRWKLAQEISAGCIVERHLVNGDTVLFNRQPSLHKNSIMSHSVKVVPWRTFRFNECVCAPYNADYDGDEMNLHVPQTEEARAEAKMLLSTLRNIVTARNGEPLIAATQDFLTASYLLTRKDSFFDRGEVGRLTCFITDAREGILLPHPAIVKPIELWTGKQIYTVILSSAANYDYNLLRGVTMSCPEKSYSFRNYATDSVPPHMCPHDGWVCFWNGELISGQLGKKSLGSGSKRSILYCVMRECGPEVAAEVMNRIAKFSARWHSDAGFSIGADDVRPSEKLQKKKAALVEAGYKKCDEIIEQLRRGELQPRPGCNQEQTMEALVNMELSNIREDGGKACISEIDPKENAALAMALCGSKGSNINISQMVACVGQQTVGGIRPPDGFFGRALPHFEPGLRARAPGAKGFVKNSFFTGMTCTEFFFHTMGGREGLVDTAVKTAQTGYMQRRLMKALEDLGVLYDHTVRASDGSVVQFTYGDDGLDPAEMESESNGRPINFERSLDDAVAANSNCRFERWLSPEELLYDAERVGEREDMSAMGLPLVIQETSDFISKLAKKHETARKRAECIDDIHESTKAAWLASIDAAHGVRRTQLNALYKQICAKTLKAKVEPGTTVGALGATSIGEPATQMTLKTFHFAGVASMNITLGVPRITEIINASRKISTPIITAPLVNETDVVTARIVKGRIECTTLGQVAKNISEVYNNGIVYLSINLDTETISKLQLNVTVTKVRQSILKTLKMKEKDVEIRSSEKIRVHPSPSLKGSLFNQINALKTNLPQVIVEGLPHAKRAVINDMSEGKGTAKYNLLVEGDGLLSVMTTPGVRGEETTCNHIAAVEKTLGIEAARKTIMNEIVYTMESHGMSIDSRHVMLLADVMSFRGEILGIQRFGIIKMKTSTLMLASFETAVDHLFDASVHSRKDDVVGVSECIILGVPIPLGTGLFRLLLNANRDPIPPRRRLLLRDAFRLKA